MKIVVIDGQGGGIGKALIQRLLEALPDQRIIALGANALATSAMLRAGAQAGATGASAVICQCRDADIILGPAGIILADAMLGEISPAIAVAVGRSPAVKILIPSDRCKLLIAGLPRLSTDEALKDAVSKVVALVNGGVEQA